MFLRARVSFSGDDFVIFSLGQDGRQILLSHAISFELNAVCIMDQPIENCIGDGGIPYQFVLGSHGDLSGYEG